MVSKHSTNKFYSFPTKVMKVIQKHASLYSALFFCRWKVNKNVINVCYEKNNATLLLIKIGVACWKTNSWCHFCFLWINIPQMSS